MLVGETRRRPPDEGTAPIWRPPAPATTPALQARRPARRYIPRTSEGRLHYPHSHADTGPLRGRASGDVAQSAGGRGASAKSCHTRRVSVLGPTVPTSTWLPMVACGAQSGRTTPQGAAGASTSRQALSSADRMVLVVARWNGTRTAAPSTSLSAELKNNVSARTRRWHGSPARLTALPAQRAVGSLNTRLRSWRTLFLFFFYLVLYSEPINFFFYLVLYSETVNSTAQESSTHG